MRFRRTRVVMYGAQHPPGYLTFHYEHGLKVTVSQADAVPTWLWLFEQGFDVRTLQGKPILARWSFLGMSLRVLLFLFPTKEVATWMRNRIPA